MKQFRMQNPPTRSSWRTKRLTVPDSRQVVKISKFAFRWCRCKRKSTSCETSSKSRMRMLIYFHRWTKRGRPRRPRFCRKINRAGCPTRISGSQRRALGRTAQTASSCNRFTTKGEQLTSRLITCCRSRRNPSSPSSNTAAKSVRRGPTIWSWQRNMLTSGRSPG